MGLASVSVMHRAGLMIAGSALSLEALDRAVAYGHSGIKLVKAKDNMHVVGEDGSSGLAVWLGMTWVARGVGSCRVQQSNKCD